MGFVLSKFRKEKTTAVILEGLEEQIQQLEKYTINTQERKKRFVSNFLGISIGVYVVVFVLLYFFYLPPTWKERIMYLVPLLLFPIVINLLRKLFTWYFQRKLNKNADQLSELRNKKAIILEQVMDKETYKVAVNLLERFGDKRTNRLSMGTPKVPGARWQVSDANKSLLNRSSEVRSANALPRHLNAASTVSTPSPYKSVYRELQRTPQSIQRQSQSSLQLSQGGGQEVRRRPFPVIDARNRTTFDRIVDALVGDSPHDRFAMICKECFAHNGMAPKDEFEYATFRCAFCNALNPARKARPVAPMLKMQLITESQERRAGDSSDSSSSDDDENSDTERQATRITQLTEQFDAIANMTESVEATAAEPLNDNISEDIKTELISSQTPLLEGQQQAELGTTLTATAMPTKPESSEIE